MDDNAEGWRIYKWAVSAAQDDTLPRVTFPPEKWISSRILAYVENEGTRHFEICTWAEDPQIMSMILWVFTPDVSFSASANATNRFDPTRAMKVMWQIQSGSADKEAKTSFRYESLSLPANLISPMQKALEDSQEMLPPSSRTFNEWKVGLLQRFSIHDM